MYRLICPCGQEITVRGSQAGCQLTCDCGKTFRIPALSELMVHQERNEATPAVDLPQFGGHDMTLEQMPATAGAAFAFPIGDGRFSVCRVLLDPSSHGQRGESLDFMTGLLDGRRKHNILVACSKWIGNRIRRADDPALRTLLHLNHHSHEGGPNVLWISLTEKMPEDFIYIGTIVPSAKEIEINCNVWGSWSSVTCQPLIQWRWDNDRDALLADEAKKGRVSKSTADLE